MKVIHTVNATTESSSHLVASFEGEEDAKKCGKYLDSMGDSGYGASYNSKTVYDSFEEWKARYEDMKREIALNKLTDAERKILGV